MGAHLLFRTVLFAVCLCFIGQGAGGQISRQHAPPPTFDEVTGRTLAHFPPSPTFDHLHMALDLSWLDPKEAKLEATERLTVKARGRAREVLKLNAPTPEQMKLTEVRCDQRQDIKHKHSSDELEISIAPAASVDEELTFTFKYSLDFSKSKSEGLMYHNGRTSGKNETETAPMIFSQGEAELNRMWFICHDFPNERLTTEINVRLPVGFQAISNGGLVAHTVGADFEQWHWRMSLPHVNYLVVLAIGKWSEVKLDPAKIERDGKTVEIPCSVWTAIGTEEQAKAAFTNTGRMIEFFSKKFDEPYPWERYDQVLVRNFGNGGMENTTATILGDLALRNWKPEESELEVLISHELSHQWFGNLVTCRSWEHIWLNEGWASFSEGLWAAERAGGGEAGRLAHNLVLEHYRDDQYIGNADAPVDATAMVDRRYRNPDAVFEKADNPYSKGAWVLQMLRERVGEEAFWRGAHAYLDKWKFGETETADLRREMEQASGESLEFFFDQWCYRPGIPMIEYSVEWEPAGMVTIDWKQTQDISASRPAWEMTLPFVLERDGQRWRFVIPISGRAGTSKFPAVAGEKPNVIMDPDMTVLCSVREVVPSTIPIR